MNRKLVVALAVGAMIMVTFVPLFSGESDAEPSASKTVHPAPSSDPWVSRTALRSIGSFYYYFTEDPTDGMIPYIMGEISLSEFKTTYGYIDTMSLPDVDCYHGSYSGTNNFYVSSYQYVTALDIEGLSNGGYDSNPDDPLRQYINRTISLDEFRTLCGHTDTYTSGQYRIDYNGYSFNITNPYEGYSTYRFIPYTEEMYFYLDPGSDLQKFADGQMSLETVKSRCRYADSSTIDWSKPHYSVSFSGGTFRIVSPTIYHQFVNPTTELRADAYFTSDPYDTVVSYIKGEIDLDTLKASCGYTRSSERIESEKYYLVSINGSNVGNAGSYVRNIHVTPEYIFLDVGIYYLNITDTDCTDYISIQNTNPSGRYNSIEIKNRRGSDDINVKASDMIWFTIWNDTTQLEDSWREKSITYTINPPPSEGRKVTDFSKTVTVLTDMEWIKYTTVDSYTGEYKINSSGRYLFVQGSDEEKLFLENVIEKGLMDGSGYSLPRVTANNQKLVAYELRESSRWTDSYIYLDGTIDESSSGWISAECTAEKMTIFGVDPFKFYAKYDFTIAVHYDTSAVWAVVMMYSNILGQTTYSVLESDRVYNFHMATASEYELYCIPVSSSSGVITPTEIGLYTENVAEADDNGNIFAIVSIALCIIAFSVLFIAGRRPKWNDSAGLPDDDGYEPPSAVSEDVSSAEEIIVPEAESLTEGPNTKDE